MAEAALDISLVREFPLAWTTAELERWMAKLPAQDRAEIIWTAPHLEAALEPLLHGALDAQLIDTATLSYVRVLKGCRRIILRMLTNELPIEPLYQRWLDRIPDLRVFLGSPMSGAHAEKSLRLGIGFSLQYWKRLRELPSEERAEVHQRLIDNELTFPNHEPSDDHLRATLLVSALLEAMARGISAYRGRELARLALRHMVRGLDGLRRQGVEYDDIMAIVGFTKEDWDDTVLDAASTLVLADRYDLVNELQWPLVPIDAATFEAWKKRFLPWLTAPTVPRIRRFQALVSSIAFQPAPFISFVGDSTWYPATGPLIDRAMVLREKPVLATLLIGAQPRLLRIDPADSPPTSDKDVRTRDMLHDWDELLERLAK